MLQHGANSSHFWAVKREKRRRTPYIFNPSYSKHHVIATIFSCMHLRESLKASLDSIVAAATVWDFLSIFNKTWKYRISQLTSSSSGPNPSQRSRVYHSSAIELSAIATKEGGSDRDFEEVVALKRTWRKQLPSSETTFLCQIFRILLCYRHTCSWVEMLHGCFFGKMLR